MSKKVCSRIVFEDILMIRSAIFVFTKKNGCPARCIKSKDNYKSARMQHTCETSKIE